MPDLKGRDLRALAAYRDKLKAALGKALVSLRFMSRRPVDAPAEAAAPPRPAPAAGAGGGGGGKLAIQPAPEAPSELRVLTIVERRDVWVEERVDEAGLDVALETGAVVAAFVYTKDEWESPLSRVTRLHAEAARGEDLP